MSNRIEKREGMRGGNGTVVIEHILDDAQMNGMCRMYAMITLAKGCSIGYHEHMGESETFYILTGNGIYTDNGTDRSITAGDTTYTPTGNGHGIANAGDDDLVFMALIINDEKK